MFFMNIEIDLLECWWLPRWSHYQNQNIYLFISILIFLSSRSILSSLHFFNEDLKPINYNLPQGKRLKGSALYCYLKAVERWSIGDVKHSSSRGRAG